MHGLGNPTRGTNTELCVWYHSTILDVSHVFHVFIVWSYIVFSNEPGWLPAPIRMESLAQGQSCYWQMEWDEGLLWWVSTVLSTEPWTFFFVLSLSLQHNANGMVDGTSQLCCYVMQDRELFDRIEDTCRLHYKLPPRFVEDLVEQISAETSNQCRWEQAYMIFFFTQSKSQLLLFGRGCTQGTRQCRIHMSHTSHTNSRSS